MAKNRVLYIVTVAGIDVPMDIFRDFHAAEAVVHALLDGHYIGFKTEKYSDKTTQYCSNSGLKAWITAKKVV